MKATNLSLLSKKYPNQWIAVESHSGTVVGVSKSAKEAYQQAQKRGIKAPLMMKVPEEYGRTYIFATS